jgi:hypothetical protein
VLQVAWSNYCRGLFRVGGIYKFTELQHDRFFLVAENKSFAGRETRRVDEAQGRTLSIVWFEKDVAIAAGHGMEDNVVHYGC